MDKELDQDDLLFYETLDQLAVVLTRQEELLQAENCYRRSLHLMSKTLTWKHPKVLTALTRLDALLKTQGKTNEAAQLIRFYDVPDVIETILQRTLSPPREYLYIGLIHDPHNDCDVKNFVEEYIPVACVPFYDDSVVVEVLLNPKAIRLIIILSQRALLSTPSVFFAALHGTLKDDLGRLQKFGKEA